MKRKSPKKSMEKAKAFFEKHGQKPFEIAKNIMLREEIKYKPVHEALRYFMEEVWRDVQHPALLSLACEAVGGNPDSTTNIGAAIVLLTGAADIHDDIIDKSKIKGSKPTIFGKFGEEIALLVGDALMFEGLTLLHDACKRLLEKQRQAILDLTKEAFFEMGSAEAKEISLRGKLDLPPEEYLSIIEMKAAVAEMTMKIGAILGGGKAKQVEVLGDYGRTLAVLMTIRDDFIDMFEPDELTNRIDNEVLPLPVLYALKDRKIRNVIKPLFLKANITEDDAQKIVSAISSSKDVQRLKKTMRSLTEVETDKLGFIREPRISKFMELLLKSSVEDL